MKPYMNNEELIDELVIHKNINRETIPENIFNERGYTTLVSPYKRLICTNFDTMRQEYIYKENGDFAEYINLAKMDDFISNKFSMYIECFEKHFKTYVAEKLSEKFKDTNLSCNDYSELSRLSSCLPSTERIQHCHNILQLNCHFNCYDLLYFDKMYNSNMREVQANKNIIANRKRALDTILKLNTTHGYSSNLLIQHNFDKNTVPPIWGVIHTLSLGDVLALYNMLKIQDRLSFCQTIYKKQNVSYREINALSSSINFIRKIRNNINQYEPLIPVLLKYQNEGKEEAIFKILVLLKDLYFSGNIHSINVVRRVKFQKLSKCDYNKKQVVYLNKILRNI